LFLSSLFSFQEETIMQHRVSKVGLETLESRRLLASTGVEVAYDPTTNTITVEGSKANDQILISGNEGVGYTITGLGGTTVNGDPSVHITPPGTPSIRTNFDVDLGKGNDSVLFNNFAALGVDVEAGQGNDVVDLFNVTVFEGLDVELGQGNDILRLTFVDIHQGLRAEGGPGDDDVIFGDFLSGTTIFSGDVKLEGGPGDDDVIGEAFLHVLAGETDFENF
jgi:hypothetical protein